MNRFGAILRRRVPLRVVVFLTCVALIAASAGTVALISFEADSALMLHVAGDSFEKTGVETIENTEYLLQPVAAAIDAMATLIEEDDAAVARPDLPRLLFGMVDLYPQVYGAYVAAEGDGRLVQVYRLDPTAKVWGPRQSVVPAGSRFVLRNVVAPDSGNAAAAARGRVDSYRYLAAWGQESGSEEVPGATYDPRVRPFYRAASARGGRVLTDIYTFASNGKSGITIARRLERAGRVVGVVAADITLEQLSAFLGAQPVGSHGLVMITDAEGAIVAAPAAARHGETVRDPAYPALAKAWEIFKSSGRSSFTFASADGDHLAAFRRFPASFDKDWVMMEVAPVDDFVGALKTTLREISVVSLIVAALGGCLSLVVAAKLTRPIEALTREADAIRALSLDGAIEGSSRIREIQHLIESMAAMKTALRSLAGDETDQASIDRLVEQSDRDSPHAKLFRKVVEKVELRRARDTELALASAIQHSVLPQADTGTHRPVQISARMRAAKEIGGDFYDWIWRDDDRLVFVIGDVSGKGIPAALFMASTRTAIRTMIMAGGSIAETVGGTNRLLAENNDRCFFVTLFIGEFDLRDGRLSYVNCGHEPARIVAPGHAVAELNPGGPALGVVEDAEFEIAETFLQPGDMLVALTDGVTDAVDHAGDRFGENRLAKASTIDETDAASGVVERIFAAVDVFAGAEEQFDDITCIVLRYQPDSVADRVAA